MAVVSGFSKETIRKYAGVIDFYYWKGIPVARKWPVWKLRNRTPGQIASSAAFSQAMIDLKLVTPHLRDVWRALYVGKAPAWVDVYKAQYMGYWKIYRRVPNVMTDFKDFGDV